VSRPAPKGRRRAVAARRSGLIRTSVTVTWAPASAGSRSSPRARISASAWRNASPTRSWRWLGALLLCRVMPPLDQLARDFLDLEALDLVALLDVLVALEGHAAFEAFLHLAGLVLEALQGLQRTFVNHDVVAQQADLGAALDQALGHHAASDLAHLGDVEHLADLGVAQEPLAQRRREHAGERRLHV